MVRHPIHLLVLTALAGHPVAAQRFFPDDPLWKEPKAFDVEGVNYRSVNFMYERFQNVFKRTSQNLDTPSGIPAQGTNTLGEVMDGGWYVNRHAFKRMTVAELKHGPGTDLAPDMNSPLRVVAVRKYDTRPGLLVTDSRNGLYFFRFDPRGQIEVSTGAAKVSAHLLHAMGYWVPQHHIVRFERKQLVASPQGRNIDATGKAEKLLEDDIEVFLQNVPKDGKGAYRAVAITAPPNSSVVGPFQFFGWRSDDPNDVVPHEHRRDLRGLHVISSWLDNNWISSPQTMDAVTLDGETHVFRHYFIDLATTLGGGFQRERDAREGNEPLFDRRMAMKNLLSFGVRATPWQKAKHANFRGVGMFESKEFDPVAWYPNYAVPALVNRLRDDDYWAAKKVVAFSDEDIRAVVETGEYTDPRAVDWITRCLMERRDKIGKLYMTRVLALENIRIENGELRFEDLATVRGYRAAQDYKIEWSSFDNVKGEHTAIQVPGDRGASIIPQRLATGMRGSYFAAKISGAEKEMSVTAYFRAEANGPKLVGIDRDWPGKAAVAAKLPPPPRMPDRWKGLEDSQQRLIADYAERYNKKTGFHWTPEQAYQSLSLSERTTFEGISHALLSSKLTDKEGNSLGRAIDLVAGLDRVAGQYYGRQGDEQFRLYVHLRPDAREILDKSQQFRFGHENTIYHAGYPNSYRQDGKEPNMQFSLSADGLKADIDVDYRTSKAPQAMWSGHLTSANSDVRAGNNYRRHDSRWAGLVNWWQEILGNISPFEGGDHPFNQMIRLNPTPLPPDRRKGAPIAQVYDAMQEFLRDWLIDQDYDEALDFVSDQALACVNLDDSFNQMTLSADQLRKHLREGMQQMHSSLGAFSDLTNAIEAVTPWRKSFKIIEHPFSREFALFHAPAEVAKAFACQDRSDAKLTAVLDDPSPAYADDYAAWFRFRLVNGQGAVIAIHWKRIAGHWKIQAWKLHEP